MSKKNPAEAYLQEALKVLAEAERSIKDVRRKARIRAIKLSGQVRDKCEETIVNALRKAGLPQEAIQDVLTEGLHETLDGLEETITEVVTEALIQVLQQQGAED